MDESEEDEQERKKRLKREADRRSTQLSRQRKKAFDEDHDYSEEEEEEEEEEEDDDDDTPVVRRKKKKAAPTAFLRKLLDLVEDSDVPEIAWNEDGTGVSLQRGPALDRVLGDRFAAKNEWNSFLTQLSFYNFTRSSREGNTVVYENASFTRTSTLAQIATIPRRSATATRQATGAPAVEAPLTEEEDPAPAAFRKRKRDATGQFAARKKAAGAPLHDLLDLFADDDKEE